MTAENSLQKGSTLVSLNYPNYSLEISEDNMEARLSLVGVKNSFSIDQDSVRKFLEEQGILVGILEKSIQNFVAEAQRDAGPPSQVLVARGVHPGISPDTILKLKVKGIESEEVYANLTKMTLIHYYSLHKYGDFDRVTSGMDLLTLPRSPLAPGTDVFGKKVEATQSFSQFQIGEGIEFDPVRKTYVSRTEGIASLLKRKLEIFQVNYDGYAQVKVDAKYMEASCEFFPAHPSGKKMEFSVVEDQLNKLKILNFVDLGFLRKQVLKAQNITAPFSEILAKGIEPINGKDGYIEYLIDLSEEIKPKVNESGGVDFKNISLIKPVKEGQHLARVHPPKKGVQGKNLMGVAISATNGNPVQAPVGTNTYYQEETNLIVSSTKGNARLNGNLIEVSESYIVEGNVDFNTGNIDYPKTVLIRGDVKSGFSVDTGGDLEVIGIIEDSKINVGGKCLIRGGFIGTGKGILETKDSLGVAYVRNQTIKCRNSLAIAGEAINATMYSRTAIEVGGRALGIVGGCASALNEIYCESAGNEAGSKTLLEVGVDFALIEEKYKTEEKIKELGASKIKIDNHLGKLFRIRKIKKSLPENEMILMQKLAGMRTKIGSQIELLENRINLIKEKLTELGKPRIIINHTTWPGVTVKIAQVQLVIERKIEGRKIFYLENGEIKYG